VLLGVLRQPKGEHGGIRLLGRRLVQDQQAEVIRLAVGTGNLQINGDPVFYSSPERMGTNFLVGPDVTVQAVMVLNQRRVDLDWI